MRSSKQWMAIAALTLVAAVAQSAGIDMKDPRRALGREDDIRVDAQMLQDTLSPSSSFGIKYQIQNLRDEPIAFAEKVVSVSYEPDTRTIVLSVGSEIPEDGALRSLVTIAPGAKKTFNAGGVVNVPLPMSRSMFATTPRYVQVKVNVLRSIAPFRDAITRQSQTPAPLSLSDEQFDRWLDLNETIFLNAIPVRWTSAPARGVGSADEKFPGTSSW